MSTQPPLPTVIGPTENALRALLTKVLSTSRIKTYNAWVVLNAAANASQSSTSWRHSVATALKVSIADIDACLAALHASDLWSDDGSLTPLGVNELTEARSAVRAVTAHLVEGISEEDQQLVRTVLERVRSRAEAMLAV